MNKIAVNLRQCKLFSIITYLLEYLFIIRPFIASTTQKRKIVDDLDNSIQRLAHEKNAFHQDYLDKVNILY